MMASEREREQPAGYPKVVLKDSRPTGRPPLPPLFHQRNLAILVSRSEGEDEWPPDPEDAAARERFAAGQAALYETKDPGLAIRCFKEAVTAEPGYLKAWV